MLIRTQNSTATTNAEGKDEPESQKTQIVLNVASVILALVAVYEVLGVSDFFAVKGQSNDDAQALAEDSAWKLLFDPAGFALLLTLFVAAIVLHSVSKRMPGFSNALTRAGLITTGVAFVLSLFRISMIFPLLSGGMGMVTNEIQNGSDVRAPAPEEFVLEAAQLIQYREATGVRITSALTNSSGNHWQSATVALTYTDAGGTVCGGLEQIEDFIAPGQQRPISTKFLSAPIYYSDPSCVPAAATAELVSIDVDSRSQINTADYEGAAIAFDSLLPDEEPWVGDGAVKLSVTGTVAPDSMSALSNGTNLPVGFEVVDQQGFRLDSCFKPGAVASDGTFTTRGFHSPVAPGEFPAVIVVPEC